MNEKQSPVAWKPIVTVTAGTVTSILIIGLTLGAMTPLGFVIFGLSMVFTGIWILTHYSSKWTRVLAAVMIFSPVVMIYVAFFGMIFHQL